MNVKKKVGQSGQKGLKSEELVRNYFLGAGFYVLRGVPYRYQGADLTDIDLWIYERSNTLARRRTVIDIKDKKVPQAAERMLFVKGLAEILKVEGAGVATTDNRSALRELARRHTLVWLDGADLQRFKASPKLASPARISEEHLRSEIAQVDASRASRDINARYDELKSSVGDRFGALSANTALENLHAFGSWAVQAHAGSQAAQLFVRLTYFAASIAAISFDFIAADVALRPLPDRLQRFTDALRYGDDIAKTQQQLKWTEAALADFAPNGASLARTVRDSFLAALNSIDVESFAEFITKAASSEALFEAAKVLEVASFSISPLSFDELPTNSKSLMGAALDFAGISRRAFADACPARVGGSKASSIVSASSTSVDSGESAAGDHPKSERLL